MTHRSSPTLCLMWICAALASLADPCLGQARPGEASPTAKARPSVPAQPSEPPTIPLIAVGPPDDRLKSLGTEAAVLFQERHGGPPGAVINAMLADWRPTPLVDPSKVEAECRGVSFAPNTMLFRVRGPSAPGQSGASQTVEVWALSHNTGVTLIRAGSLRAWSRAERPENAAKKAGLKLSVDSAADYVRFLTLTSPSAYVRGLVEGPEQIRARMNPEQKLSPETRQQVERMATPFKVTSRPTADGPEFVVTGQSFADGTYAPADVVIRPDGSYTAGWAEAPNGLAASSKRFDSRAPEIRAPAPPAKPAKPPSSTPAPTPPGVSAPTTPAPTTPAPAPPRAGAPPDSDASSWMRGLGRMVQATELPFKEFMGSITSLQLVTLITHTGADRTDERLFGNGRLDAMAREALVARKLDVRAKEADAICIVEVQRSLARLDDAKDVGILEVRVGIATSGWLLGRDRPVPHIFALGHGIAHRHHVGSLTRDTVEETIKEAIAEAFNRPVSTDVSNPEHYKKTLEQLSASFASSGMTWEDFVGEGASKVERTSYFSEKRAPRLVGVLEPEVRFWHDGSDLFNRSERAKQDIRSRWQKRVTFSATNPHAAKPYHQSIEFRTPMGEGVVAVSAHSFVRLVEPYCLFAHAGRLRYSPAVVYTRSRGSTADPEKRSSGPGNYRDQADALIDDVAARLK